MSKESLKPTRFVEKAVNIGEGVALGLMVIGAVLGIGALVAAGVGKEVAVRAYKGIKKK